MTQPGNAPKARPSHLTTVGMVNKVSPKDLPSKTAKAGSFEGSMNGPLAVPSWESLIKGKIANILFLSLFNLIQSICVSTGFCERLFQITRDKNYILKCFRCFLFKSQSFSTYCHRRVRKLWNIVQTSVKTGLQLVEYKTCRRLFCQLTKQLIDWLLEL